MAHVERKRFSGDFASKTRDCFSGCKFKLKTVIALQIIGEWVEFFEMKLSPVGLNTKHLLDDFHVEPFTFGLEVCQFKIKGTPIYCAGLFYVVVRRVHSFCKMLI